MEASRFELLLRRATEQTTRRETLGALAGGALLLNSRGEVEGTDKAKRRRKRKRKQRKARFPVRDVSFWINNRARSASLIVTYGGLGRWPGYSACTASTVIFNPGESHRLFASSPFGYMWLDERYFIYFENLPFQQPTVWAAEDGRVEHFPCNRLPVGVPKLEDAPLGVGTVVPFSLYGYDFSAKRYGDTRTNMIFEVILPANA